MPANAVMIIPKTPVNRIFPRGQRANPAKLSLHQENWVWAQQFKAVAPGPRDVVEVPVNGKLETDFTQAIRHAAAKAEKGGMVILFTGHGTRAGCAGGMCTFNSPPQQFEFDSVPETDGHERRISKQAMDIHEVAEQKDGKWVPKPRLHPGSTTKVTEPQSKIDQLAVKWAVLQTMKAEFTRVGIDRLVLLTCNLGTFPNEVQQLANLIQTTVVVYREKIVTREIDPSFDEPPNKLIRPVFCWTSSAPHTKNMPLEDPFFALLFKPQTDAVKKHILANWKRHPYFSQLPLGAGVECKPGGTPNAFG